MADGYLAAATSSASDNWPTPPWVVRRAIAEFGPFDLDPATNPDNPVGAIQLAKLGQSVEFHTVDDDGLAVPWKGRVWLNPPYGRTIGRWIAKARGEVEAGHAELAVCLVPVRVDARWWQDNVIHARPKPLVRFWPKRLRYIKDWDAPFASATVVYGHRATGRRHGTVAGRCPECPPGERIFWPSRSDQITCSKACRDARHRDGNR